MSTLPSISLHPHSLLMTTPLLLVNNTPEWGIHIPLEQQSLTDDQTYVTVANDRMPIITHAAYGDVRLWWVIYDYNRSVIGKSHPLFLPAGLTLRIPPIERALAEAYNV